VRRLTSPPPRASKDGSGPEVDFSRQFASPVEHLSRTLAAIRPEPTVGFVGSYRVEHNGSPTPVSVVASIIAKGESILINPYDFSLTSPIAKALSGEGFNAYAADKRTVIVSFPPPSGEERERIARRVVQLGEEAKVAVRAVRQNLRKSHPDDEKAIQKETDAAIVAMIRCTELLFGGIPRALRRARANVWFAGFDIASSY
jgi:ribosome recycling factor